MNPYDILFCWAPIGIGVVLPALYILSMIAGQKAKADALRSRDLERARLIELREADARRKAELHEARIARENNAVVLQEAKLELEQLKIRKARKDLSLDVPPFNPDEFTPKQ